MTKDNLGNERWQSDQARIAALEKRIAILDQSLDLMRKNLDFTLFEQAKAEREYERAAGRIREAAALIERYGMTGGEHHKTWLVDQVLWTILGEGYDAWVEAYNRGDYVKWDTGIAP